jgi:hypothetical protein
MMSEIPQLQMDGAGAAYSSVKKAAKSVRTAIRGYEEYVDKNGRKVRVYGGLNGMSPSEYDDWWNKRGKYARPASKKASPPLRRSLRIKEKKEREESKKRRASMGGSRKNGKTRKRHH